MRLYFPLAPFRFTALLTYPIKHRLAAVNYKFMLLIHMLTYFIHKITLHMKQLSALAAFKMIMLHTSAAPWRILIAGAYAVLYGKFPHHILRHQLIKISVHRRLSYRSAMQLKIIYYHIRRHMYILVFYHVIKYHFPLLRPILCHTSS